MYLDASAVVKLVLPEAETAALQLAVARWSERLSSAIVVAEVERAVRRQVDLGKVAPRSARVLLERTRQVLDGLEVMDVDLPSLRRAGSQAPPSLRTLDAIHLATALEIGAEIEAVITYDRRLGEALETAGIKVLAPA